MVSLRNNFKISEVRTKSTKPEGCNSKDSTGCLALKRYSKFTLVALLIVLMPQMVRAQTPVPAPFFGVSVFSYNDFPLNGGITLGTLGKLGGISAYSIEPTCDGGTNPSNSCYTWTNLDNWVNYAQAHNMTLVYDWYVPGWQCGLGPGVDCRVMPTNITWMSNLATALATRYAGKIQYYETGNEANSFFQGTCAQLVLLHNTIYTAIKAADPKAIVGAPNMTYESGNGACSTSPTPVPNGKEWIWLQNFLQTRDSNGNLPTVDTAGEHFYQVTAVPLDSVGDQFLTTYNGFRSVMTAAGISTSMPLLVTEASFGPDTNDDCAAPLDATACLSAADQVAYIGRWLVLGASTFSDGGGLLGSWYAYDINVGTLNGTLGMNPQNASAYGQMESWVTGAAFLQECQTGNPSTLLVCDFTAGGANREVVFNANNGATANYTAPAWAVYYQQLLGTQTPIAGAISVGNSPILLTPGNIEISINTNPSGLSFTVDGTMYDSAQTLTWASGTSHTISISTPQGTGNTQYTFASWSDGTTDVSDTVTATINTTSYTATFNPSYQLTAASSPSGGGTVSPASGTYYPSGAVVNLSASPNSGYIFSGWTGPVAVPSSASTTVTMNAPESVTANFLLTQAIQGSSFTGFGSANVCPGGQTTPAPCSQSISLNYNVNAITTFGTVKVLTQGASNLDFTLSNTSCAGTVTAGNSCAVNVQFAPLAPGLRMGAVQLMDNSGNLLATTFLSGQGQGPAIAFGPGAQTIVGSGLNLPNGLAVDGAGNVFIADTNNNRVVEVPASGGAQTTVGSGLGSPAGVAVDGAGDVFIADTNNNRVVEVPASGGAQTTVGSGLGSPAGVAVDGAGDVFIADTNNNRVVEVPASGGAQTTVGSGLGSPAGVAVDGAGDVFIADTNNNRVVEDLRSQPPMLSFAATILGSTSTDSPQSVTVQNIGNQLLNAVSPGLSVGANFTQVAGAGTPADCNSGFSLVSGASCNLSISFNPQTTGNIVSAATFTDNALNATGATQNLTLQGTGNPKVAPTVSFTGAPATAADNSSFTVSATTNASTTAVVTASGACTVTSSTGTSSSINMTSGTGTCSLAANWAADSNYLAASASQSTTATKIAPTVAFTGAPATAANNSSFTVSATTNASTTAVVTASGACTVTSSTGTSSSINMTSGTGTCSLVANWAADSNYLAASASQSTTATKIAPTVSFSGAPATAAYSSSFIVSATTNASTTAVVTASGACTVTSSTGTSSSINMTSGTGTCSLAANWAADSNYLAASASQSTTATKIAPTVAFTGAPATAADNSSFTVSATTNASTTAVVTASGACAVTSSTGTSSSINMTSGTGTCSLAANWAADSNYLAASASQSTTATKIAPTVAFTGAPATAADNSSFTVSATTNASTIAVVTASGACTVKSSTGTSSSINMTSGTGTCSLAANWAADSNYLAASASQSTTATKIAPTVSFSGAPATAAYSSSFIVSATTNASTTAVVTASGACAVTSSTGTSSTVKMTSGSGSCSLGANWAADSNYLAASASQSTTAAKIAPTVAFTGAPATAANNSSFTVSATTNASTTAVVTASGACAVTSSTGTSSTVKMTSGTGSCSLVANWAADSNYLAASASQSTTATKDMPTINWTTPAAITYGTALSATQLDATATYNGATVPGTFVYTPAKGTVLAVGAQLLSVTFTPTNTAVYTAASASVTLQVNAATPKITWAKPAAITYGTALSSKQLDATTTVAGTFTYSPAAGTLLGGGTQTLSVTFTPTNTTDYTTATDSVTITVNKATSTTVITSSAPNPSIVGQAVTVKFSVTGTGVPTGTVTATASTGQSCNGTLNAGAGSCSLTFTAAGSPKLTASYAGDNNFNSSTSAKVTQTVQK
jgi:Bacterial Ig-like domain (group 3)/NHL repeat